jgi:hypothetical protein
MHQVTYDTFVLQLEVASVAEPPLELPFMIRNCKQTSETVAVWQR